MRPRTNESESDCDFESDNDMSEHGRRNMVMLNKVSSKLMFPSRSRKGSKQVSNRNVSNTPSITNELNNDDFN